jgi:hypothetical protein
MKIGSRLPQEQLFPLAFFRGKSPSPENPEKPKIWKFYQLRRHGTRHQLKNGRGFQIFGPFCDLKATLPSLELWQGQKRPINEFLKISSETALTIFLIYCVKIPDLIRNNFSLWQFFVKIRPP